jgi:hypothetical protein
MEASVAERQETTIVFVPASVRPSKNEPWEQCAALLLNPCDGFHLVYAYFDGDGEFDRFSDFASSELYAEDFYVAWALLPDESPLIYHFDPKRRPHGVTACQESEVATAEELRIALREMIERKDGAYEERNKVVAALAKVFPSGIARTAIEGWSEDWHGCVYIDLPTGQVSWHFHDSQEHLFAGLPPYTKEWDGHDTPEKYRRLSALGVTACDGGKPE